MAHHCPSCGEKCYCRGDTDNLELRDVEDEYLCEHCPADEPIEEEANKEQTKGGAEKI